MNDVPLQEHVTPHYVKLGLLKFRDIVEMYTCLFLYDYLCHNKPCNFPISLVSQQYNYSTRSASTQQLHLSHFRINIRTDLSDERFGAKLRVTENRCVVFDSSTYVSIYVDISFVFLFLFLFN